MKDFWILLNKDTKTVDNISYSEATYSAKVKGGYLYRVDWFITDGNGYVDSGKSITFAEVKGGTTAVISNIRGD